MRKVWAIFLLTTLSLTLSACGNMASTKSEQSARITRDSAVQVSDAHKDALRAYYDILSQEKYQNEDADVMKTYFAISDLNTDGIPELLINSCANIMEYEQYYTYENGTATKIDGPAEGEGYTRNCGKLYLLPSRNTYAFFLEGPTGRKDDGNLYRSFSLAEYAIENHQIHKINDVLWEVCEANKSNSQTDTSECTWNDKECSLDEIVSQYQLEKTKDEHFIYFDFPSQKDNRIKFLPNTDANRKAVCTDSNPTIYALDAYYDLLSGEQYQNKDGEDNIMGIHFAISDLNADGIPELLISSDNNMLSLNEYYTYENGTIVKIAGPEYPQYGSLYALPHRSSYAFFRGGPAWTDEEDGHGYMPYLLVEYTLDLKNHQITTLNRSSWNECDSGTVECELNGQKCSPKEIIEQYSMKKAITGTDFPMYTYTLPEENYIELQPNTDANRKAIITKSVSDSDTK